jgi:hypothetical protein
MIWPFKRKPTIDDRRDGSIWQVGERAICVVAGWHEADPCDPEPGDVLTVAEVFDDTAPEGVRAIWLTFKAISGRSYESGAFRKLVEADDAATIARIKSAGKPKVASLNPSRHSRELVR